MPSRHPRFSRLPEDLFRDLRSFAELEVRMTALAEELVRGDALEVFAEAYLWTSSIWQVKELWLVGQVPLDVQHTLNLSERSTGIDGVFQSKDGSLVPYQVKFRIGRPQVGVGEVATFFAVTDRGQTRVLVSNSDRYADEVERRDRLRIVRGADFDGLTADDLRAIEHWIYGEPV